MASVQGSSAQLRRALTDGCEDREELKDADIFQGSIRKNNDSFIVILDATFYPPTNPGASKNT